MKNFFSFYIVPIKDTITPIFKWELCVLLAES